MILADIPAQTAVFIDANVFLFYFGPDPMLGPPCEQFLDRIENKEIQGFTSPVVLNEMVHRLMALEACATFGWPHQGIASRLKKHPTDVMQLGRSRQAIDEIIAIPVQILPVTGTLVSRATDVSRQTGLMANDALLVAVMREAGLTALASQDGDFDRVPGITRFAPI